MHSRDLYKLAKELRSALTQTEIDIRTRLWTLTRGPYREVTVDLPTSSAEPTGRESVETDVTMDVEEKYDC